MAAAALPALSSAAAPVVDAAKVEFEKARADPILWVSSALIKVGTVVFLLGVGAYFLARADKRAAQGFLTDIDNTLGIAQEAPPTPPRNAAPPASTTVATPAQITYLNAVVADVNSLGTASAQQNVALMQDCLKQLWSLAEFVYGDNGSGTATQEPPVATGYLLAISIMQTCTLIYEMEGRTIPNTQIWTWDYYQTQQVGAYTGSPPNKNSDLAGMSQTAALPFSLQGAPAWTAAVSMVSNTANNDNFKITLNSLATSLNASTPFDVTATSSNNWGILGTIVSDLSAIGTEIAQGAETVGSDIENAVVTAGNDLKGVFTEVGQGLAFIGKVLINFPRLTWDALGYGASWAGEMVFDYLYTPFLVAGAVMMAAGSVLGFFYVHVWPKAEARVTLAANARLAKAWEWVDAKIGTRKKIAAINTGARTEAAIEAANERAEPEVLVAPVIATPPDIDAGPAAEPRQSEPERGEEGVSPGPVVAPSQDRPPEVIMDGATSENAPAAIPEVGPVSDKQGTVPGGASTEEVEAFLGEHPTRAPSAEELKAQEANRLASMPELGPTYRQRKEEAEHERAEKLIAMGEGWGEA